MAVELTYDFSELSDGSGFPEGIGTGILRTDVGGASIEPEILPDTYYYAQDGLGTFKYTEDIAGPQTDRRGLIAVPGMLEGSNADLGIIFADPIRNFDNSLNELFVQIGLGCRAKNQALQWVGGMLESFWTNGGGWSPKWKLSAVSADGITITYHESLEADVAYQTENDLTVRVEGDLVTVAFNGVHTVQKEIAFRGGTNVVLWVKVFYDDGMQNPVPLIKSIVSLALDSGRKFKVEEMPGHFLPPPITNEHYYRIPVRELRASGSLVALTHNSWQFKEEVILSRPEERIKFGASAGAIIHAPRQTLVGADIEVCRFVYS